MLDRATCERLAEALPEVRGHEWVKGDRYYQRYTNGAYLVSPSVIVAPRQAVQGWDLWCPSLSDLLAMACARLSDARTPICLEVGWSKARDGDPEPLLDCSCFTYADGQADEEAADSPEEAVARWLLKHL